MEISSGKGPINTSQAKKLRRSNQACPTVSPTNTFESGFFTTLTKMSRFQPSVSDVCFAGASADAMYFARLSEAEGLGLRPFGPWHPMGPMAQSIIYLFVTPENTMIW